LARPPKFTDEQIVMLAMEIQKKHKLDSEGAICGRIGLGREYIANRAKDCADIKELRSEMAAIRQGAWERKGRAMLADKGSNATMYIWMTRNILGWRDERSSDDATGAVKQKAFNLTYSPDEKEKERG
jgi:hypothetical protein